MTNLLMALSWGLFYFLHTVLAASKLKRNLESKWPNSYKWYRLFYSILAIVLFAGIMIQATILPVEVMFIPGKFSQYAGFMIATAGIIVLLRSLKQISMGSFLGFRPEKFERKNTDLITSGIYSQVRHPLYLGLLGVFFGYFLVAGTMGALIHLGCLIIYLPIGIFFEEKNLVLNFGESYKEYQEEVPAIFPRIHKKKG
jgi:protein-S-isoprenylcysteine O-methyltransferase Ste14